MQFSTNLRQTLRVPARIALYLLLIAILTAFFTLSLNLWRNSQANLKLADETYQTIAVMELYADVDERGSPITDLRSAENYAGYLPTAVREYDLTPIVSALGVLSYDLRTRYAAYVPKTLALRPFNEAPGQSDLLFQHNLIRFTVNSTTPVVLRNQETVRVNINVIEDAVGLLAAEYRFKDTLNVYLDGYGGYLSANAEAIRALAEGDKPAEETVVLQPGVEYLASIFSGGASTGLDDPPPYSWFHAIGITNDLYGAERWINYSTKGGVFWQDPAEGQPFAIQRYDEVRNNHELSAYFAAVKQAYHISARSFGVIATDDVQAVPAFHLGSTYMRQGRPFTQEEYDQGARVCMVSAELARLQGWSVGDRINMNFYEYDCFSSGILNWTNELAPIYTSPQADDFFDAGEYTIVGIFDMRPATGRSSVSEGALDLPWNALFVPKRSIHNAPADETQPISGALLTIRLKNGSVGAFLDAMEARGLTGKKADGYEARFTFYDQGYAQMQPSLMALSGTAELLLILSSTLLITAAVLLAFFYALAQKQNLGVMRLLGCSRLRAFGAVLVSALLIAAVGACAGAAVGHALTERVGRGILAQATNEAAAYLAYSPMATDHAVTLQLMLGADGRVTLLALMGGLAVFMLCTSIFTARYVSQEPRSLLPQGHE